MMGRDVFVFSYGVNQQLILGDEIHWSGARNRRALQSLLISHSLVLHTTLCIIHNSYIHKKGTNTTQIEIIIITDIKYRINEEE